MISNSPRPLRQLIRGPKLAAVRGVYGAITARMADAARFPVAFMGAGVSVSLEYRNYGLPVTMNQISGRGGASARTLSAPLVSADRSAWPRNLPSLTTATTETA